MAVLPILDKFIERKIVDITVLRLAFLAALQRVREGDELREGG
jgi:hypothetical protein